MRNLVHAFTVNPPPFPSSLSGGSSEDSGIFIIFREDSIDRCNTHNPAAVVANASLSSFVLSFAFFVDVG